MVCKITDPGNPEWLYMEWKHESGMDLSGQGSDGNLTVTFDSLCMAGDFTCVPVNAIGQGSGVVVKATINGKHTYKCIVMHQVFFTHLVSDVTGWLVVTPIYLADCMD